MGIILDRIGMIALGAAIALSTIAMPLAFLGDTTMAGVGVALWGMGTVVQDSLLVAKVASEETRSTAYGVFDTIFGIAWLAGSAGLGILYDHSRFGLVALSIAAQVASAVVFVVSTRSYALQERAGA